jgi:carboxyl-terminal processing protease
MRWLVERFWAQNDKPGDLAISPDELEAFLQANDPYSDVLDTSEYQDFEREAYQKYVGIGIEIQRLQERVRVLRVFENGPAASAGMRAGDAIIAVDGLDVRNASVATVVEQLKGRPGSRVLLEVGRAENGRQEELLIRREEVAYSSVRDARLIGPGIGYLAITQFGARTGIEFSRALGRLESEGMHRALIVDLRNNPGGMLIAAIDVAETFLDSGDLIVSIEGTGRASSQDEEYRSRTGRRPAHYNIIVLQNRASASASEILAGAWQDHGVATVIGERSHGKGSVQSVFALSDGSGLRMTTAEYFLPKGESIEKVGVSPDFQVTVPFEDRYKIYLQQRHLATMGSSNFSRLFGFEAVEDPVIRSALAVLN